MSKLKSLRYALFVNKPSPDNSCVSLQEQIDSLTPAQIESLIAESSRGGSEQPRHGHQATVHVIDIGGTPIVVKSVSPERSSLVWLRRRMLVSEYRVYQRLRGLAGTPRCYGLVGGQYLLLEYIDGTVFGEIPLPLDSEVYARLLSLIESLHERGVAHADLKRSSNLILGHDEKPYLVDFGTAVVQKDGFRPLNRYLFRAARQVDYHGYIKNKYRGRNGPILEADLKYYQPMRLEQAARWLKRTFRQRLKALREKHAQR